MAGEVQDASGVRCYDEKEKHTTDTEITGTDSASEPPTGVCLDHQPSPNLKRLEALRQEYGVS